MTECKCWWHYAWWAVFIVTFLFGIWIGGK